MNIHLNDSNLIVNYIQSLLRNNYSSTVKISRKYDYNTHYSLIDYLSKPDVLSIDNAIKSINNLKFKDSNDNLIEFINIYFKYTSDLECIYFTSKNNTKNHEIESYMNNDYNKKSLLDLLESIGYELIYYNSYEVPYSITVKKIGDLCKFSRKDALLTVNLNCNKYIYNMVFDSRGYNFNDNDFVIRESSTTKTKLCILKCEPNKTYTIVCGGDGSSQYNISIGSSVNNRDDISIGYTVYNVKNYIVLSGNYIKYTTRESDNSIIIQLPLGEELSDLYPNELSSKEILSKELSILNILVISDDIDNYSKVIKNEYYRYIDYNYTEIIRGEFYIFRDGEYILEPNGNYLKAKNDEIYYLIQYNTKYYSLGTDKYYHESDEGTYIRTSIADYYVRDDIYGNYIKDINNNYCIINDKSNIYYNIDKNGNYYLDNNEGIYAVSKYNYRNIPISDYMKDNWVINDKFIEYVTGNVVSPYSESDDIAYFQDLIHKIFMNKYSSYSVGKYDDLLLSIIKEIQSNNNISYTTGLIDKDTKYIINNSL